MNILNELLSRLDKNSIQYELDKKFKKKIPKFYIPNGVNELGYIEPAPYPKLAIGKINIKIDKKNFQNFHKIIREMGFIFFPKKRFEYFLFDRKIGLVWISLLIDIKVNVNFYGKLICFVGPEGSGKTTTLSAVYTALENFPIEKKLMTFSSFKDSKLWRIYDLSKKLISSKFKGKKLILTDRYIYLTFRKNLILKRILKLFSPKPDIVFVMKSNYNALKERRGPLCSSRENVKNMYDLFGEAENKIEIDTSQNREKNLEFIINKILRLYNNEEKKYFKHFV